MVEKCDPVRSHSAKYEQDKTFRVRCANTTSALVEHLGLLYPSRALKQRWHFLKVTDRFVDFLQT
jgi:hypothetical protein